MFTPRIAATRPLLLLVLALGVTLPAHADLVPATGPASPTTQPSGAAQLARILGTWEQIIEPAEGNAPRMFTAHFRVLQAQGLSAHVAGAVGDIAFQSPAQLRIAAVVDGVPISAARNGNELWFDEPAKKFALIGHTGLPLFRATPGELDTTRLPPMALPLTSIQKAMLPLLFRVEILSAETIQGRACDVLRLSPSPNVAAMLHVPGAIDSSAVLWVHHDDLLPARFQFDQADRIHLKFDIDDATLGRPWDEAKWKLNAASDETVQTVPLAHLARFLAIARRLRWIRFQRWGLPPENTRSSRRKGRGGWNQSTERACFSWRARRRKWVASTECCWPSRSMR